MLSIITEKYFRGAIEIEATNGTFKYKKDRFIQ